MANSDIIIKMRIEYLKNNILLDQSKSGPSAGSAAVFVIIAF